ncbi:restriction endonuclease [Streptomyces sp. NPDC001553]|uniref:restriction endonuclease n=1 Tax=Streptomyces sp. NPDC001553 TaxID=3154385 RepID=UPI003326C63F
MPPVRCRRALRYFVAVTSETASRAATPGSPPEERAIRTWQDAEHNAAAWMRHWGYLDAVARPGGSDGGIDVRSTRALGQVKYQAAAVGRPELQRLFGARGRSLDRRLLFFTGSGYTTTAVDYAVENDIALFVYGLNGSMTAVNAPGRRIVQDAPVSAGGPREAAAVPVPEGPGASRGNRPEAVRPRPTEPPAGIRKRRHPGTGHVLLAALLAVIALVMPGSESFTPRPDRTVATAILLVIPCVLLLRGLTTKSRRRFWPTGLGLFLLDLPLAWATNARLWQGDASDLLLPTTPAVLCLLSAGLLFRWNARQPEPVATG